MGCKTIQNGSELQTAPQVCQERFSEIYDRIIAFEGQGFGMPLRFKELDEVDGVPDALAKDLNRGEYVIMGTRLDLSESDSLASHYEKFISLAQSKGLPKNLHNRLRIANQEAMFYMITNSPFRRSLAAELGVPEFDLAFVGNQSRRNYRIYELNDSWYLKFELENMALTTLDRIETARAYVHMYINVKLSEVDTASGKEWVVPVESASYSLGIF